MASLWCFLCSCQAALLFYHKEFFHRLSSSELPAQPGVSFYKEVRARYLAASAHSKYLSSSGTAAAACSASKAAAGGVAKAAGMAAAESAAVVAGAAEASAVVA